MIRKLLKHDLRYVFSRLGLLYVSLFLTSFILYLFLLIKTNLFARFIIPILSVMYVLMLIVSIVAGMALPIYYFYKNTFKDEGYLTLTIPVSTTTILFSKVITAYLANMTTFIIAALSLTLVLDLTAIIDALIASFGMNIVMMWIVVSLFIASLDVILSFFAIVSIGQSTTKNKTTTTIITALATYLIHQLVSALVIAFVLYLFYLSFETKSNFFALFTNTHHIQDIKAFNHLLYYIIAAQAITSCIIITVGWFVNANYLKNRVNLD